MSFDLKINSFHDRGTISGQFYKLIQQLFLFVFVVKFEAWEEWDCAEFFLNSIVLLRLEKI